MLIVIFKLPDYTKCETTLMLHQLQQMPSLRIARLLPMSTCLCAFLLFPTLQVAALAGPESAETECPCKEDGETSEKELVDWCSAHGRSNNRRHQGLSRPPGKRKQPRRTLAIAERVPAIIGHQLANGLCAPLLI